MITSIICFFLTAGFECFIRLEYMPYDSQKGMFEIVKSDLYYLRLVCFCFLQVLYSICQQPYLLNTLSSYLYFVEYRQQLALGQTMYMVFVRFYSNKLITVNITNSRDFLFRIICYRSFK